VPVNLAVCSPAGALSFTASSPLYGPTPIGENVTLIVQLPPAARLLPQLFIGTKATLVVPIEEILSGSLLLFVSVKFWGAVVAPSFS
jgi:hypothetical protein